MLQGLNAGDSAIKAGFANRAYGYKLKNQEDIKQALTEMMERSGINEELIAKKLKEGLDAMTVPRRDGGRQYEDHFIRKQFLDMVFKVRGDYAPERMESIQKTIQITLDGDLIRALRDSNVLDAQEIEYLEAVPIEVNDDTELGDSEQKVICQQEEGTARDI